MQTPRGAFRKYILPLMILVPLISIMVGCIYIPTFNHTVLLGTTKDFRQWSEQHKANPPQDRAITRASIEALFGKPAFVSKNGRCVAYVMATERNLLVWPLCFGAGFVDGDTHILKLVFDASGRLQRVVPITGPAYPPTYFFGREFLFEAEQPPAPLGQAQFLLQDNNKHCPANEVIEVPDPYANNSAPPLTTQP